MPHLIVEYTRNIKPQADIPALLKRANHALAGAMPGVAPASIRSRAFELQDYHMADGEADYAFVHATLRLDSGLTEEAKRRTADAVFDLFKQHFAALYDRRYLALSMELVEIAGAEFVSITG